MNSNGTYDALILAKSSFTLAEARSESAQVTKLMNIRFMGYIYITTIDGVNQLVAEASPCMPLPLKPPRSSSSTRNSVEKQGHVIITVPLFLRVLNMVHA